jgi:hypothetical protein
MRPIATQHNGTVYVFVQGTLIGYADTQGSERFQLGAFSTWEEAMAEVAALTGRSDLHWERACKVT